MDLERSCLDKPDQAIEAIDHKDWLLGIVVRILDGKDFLGMPPPGMFLEKALAGRALRTTQQSQRSPGYERRYALPRTRVVVSEPRFGDTGIFPINAIRMGKLDGGFR